MQPRKISLSTAAKVWSRKHRAKKVPSAMPWDSRVRAAPPTVVLGTWIAVTRFQWTARPEAAPTGRTAPFPLRPSIWSLSRVLQLRVPHNALLVLLVFALLCWHSGPAFVCRANTLAWDSRENSLEANWLDARPGTNVVCVHELLY